MLVGLFPIVSEIMGQIEFRWKLFVYFTLFVLK